MKGSVVQKKGWGEVHYMGSGTLCKTVVGKHKLSANDCNLFLFMLYTASKLDLNLGYGYGRF